MGLLIAGLMLFIGVHSISIVSEAWRNRMALRYGEQAWQGVFALMSAAGIVLIVWGYGLASEHAIAVYQPPQGLRHLASFILVLVFPLLLAAYLPGRIQAISKHPMLAATKVWAFAHLLANGMLHDILLFGAFFVWAVVARISMRRRTPRPVRGAPPRRWNDLAAIGAGLALYLVFVVHLHAWLFGVAPLG